MKIKIIKESMGEEQEEVLKEEFREIEDVANFNTKIVKTHLERLRGVKSDLSELTSGPVGSRLRTRELQAIQIALADYIENMERAFDKRSSGVLKEGEDPTVDLVAAGLGDVLVYMPVPRAAKSISDTGKGGMVSPGAEFSDAALGVELGKDLPFNAVIGPKKGKLGVDGFSSMEEAEKYASRLNQLKGGKYVYGVRAFDKKDPSLSNLYRGSAGLIYVYPVRLRRQRSLAYKALGMPTE